MQFTTSHQDAGGLAALEVLRTGGYDTSILKEGEMADEQAIALFTPQNRERLQGSRGKYLRTSATKLTNEFAPVWAHKTQFRVGVLRLNRVVKDRTRQPRLAESVLNMAKNYESLLTADPDRKREWKFQTFQLQSWRVNHTDERRVFPISAAEQVIAALDKWTQYFPRERTWIQVYKRIPSLIVRFDCVINGEGKLIIYEIEERPAGIGLASKISPDFAKEFTRVAQTWAPFRVVVSPLRKVWDDTMWQKLLPWEELGPRLVLIRAEPEEREFDKFRLQSVSSLKFKGDKSYGLGMGLWHKVHSPDELPWERSFVLKPLQGSKLKDIEIWDQKRRPGSSIRTKVEATLARNGTMYCQALHSPMETGLSKFPWMIFRILVGYNCVRNEWEILGGTWNARHNLRIHGASDAVSGPAVVE